MERRHPGLAQGDAARRVLGGLKARQGHGSAQQLCEAPRLRGTRTEQRAVLDLATPDVAARWGSPQDRGGPGAKPGLASAEE